MTAPVLLTLAEAAEQLRVHERTIRRWVAEGIAPHIRLGTGPKAPIRFTQHDLDDLIARFHHRPTTPDAFDPLNTPTRRLRRP